MPAAIQLLILKFKLMLTICLLLLKRMPNLI